MCLHVKEILRWSDKPHAIVSFYTLAYHIHHSDSPTQIFHVSSTIRYRMNRLVVKMADNEGIKGFVSQAGTTISVESYQKGRTGTYYYRRTKSCTTTDIKSLTVPIVKLRSHEI